MPASPARRGSRAPRRRAARRRYRLRQRIDEGHVHLVAEECRRRERLALSGRHAVGADEDAVAQGLGDGQVVAHECRDTVANHDRLVGRGGRQPAPPRTAASPGSVRTAAPQGGRRAGHRACGPPARPSDGGVEGTEDDLAQSAVAPQLDAQAADRVRARQFVAPVDPDDQQRPGCRGSGEDRQRVDRRVVGALQVVEDDRQWLDPGEPDRSASRSRRGSPPGRHGHPIVSPPRRWRARGATGPARRTANGGRPGTGRSPQGPPAHLRQPPAIEDASGALRRVGRTAQPGRRGQPRGARSGNACRSRSSTRAVLPIPASPGDEQQTTAPPPRGGSGGAQLP